MVTYLIGPRAESREPRAESREARAESLAHASDGRRVADARAWRGEHRALRDGGEEILDGTGRHRFGEMRIEPGLARAAPILGLAPSGQRGEIDVAQRRPLTQLLRDFVSVHDRQADVEQDDVG